MLLKAVVDYIFNSNPTTLKSLRTAVNNCLLNGWHIEICYSNGLPFCIIIRDANDEEAIKLTDYVILNGIKTALLSRKEAQYFGLKLVAEKGGYLIWSNEHTTAVTF